VRQYQRITNAEVKKSAVVKPGRPLINPFAKEDWHMGESTPAAEPRGWGGGRDKGKVVKQRGGTTDGGSDGEEGDGGDEPVKSQKQRKEDRRQERVGSHRPNPFSKDLALRAASKVAAQDAKLQRNKEVRKVESNIKERKRDSYKRKLGAGKQPKMAGQMKDLLSKLQSK
jgi:hypothetical protein